MRRIMTMIHRWSWYKRNEDGKTVPYDYLTQSVKSDGQDTNDEYCGEDPNDKYDDVYDSQDPNEYDDESDDQDPNDEYDDESDVQDAKCKMAASQPRSQKS